MAVKIILALVYLAIVFYLAYKGWKETKEASDYMLAGRPMHPFITAMSYGGTFISTAAIIGFGGAAGVFGFSLLWLTVLNIFVGIFIAMVFFGKRTRRMGIALDAHTFPEFLGRRFQSRFIQGLSGLVVFLFIPLYSAAVLIGISRMLEATVMEGLVQSLGLAVSPALTATVFHWSLVGFSLLLAVYVLSGGMKGVSYATAFQATIMVAMMVVLLVVTYGKLGGLTSAHQAVTDLANLAPSKFKAGGMGGWTVGLDRGTPLCLTVFSTLVFGVGIGVLAQPQLVLRFMNVKSDMELHRAVAYGGFFVLLTTGVAFVVGALSNAVFVKSLGAVPVEGALAVLKDAVGLVVKDEGGRIVTPAISLVVGQGNMDAIIPAYVEQMMPNWFAALFLLVMIGAALATLSSQYQAGGTALGRDFYEMALGKGGEGREITLTRVGVGLTLVMTLFWAYVLPFGVIATATAFFFGLCASAFLPAYFLGLYWKGMTRAGAAASVAGGLATSLILTLFVHRSPASLLGLLEGPLGLAPGAGGSFTDLLAFVDPNLIALPVSLILAVGVSLASARIPEDHLKLCWRFIER
jgi:SSS family solute:Na+ symporter